MGQDKVILVTGATGRQGGAVARHLLQSKWPIRIFTRDPYKPAAQDLVHEGAEVAQGDFSDRDSIAQALRGVHGVFSVQQPWESGPDVELEQGIALAQEAKRAGVQHFVYTSVGCAQCRTGLPTYESKRKIELHVRGLGIPYTILRPSYFMENFLEPSFQHSLNHGVLSLALRPEKPLQLIAVEDIGAIASLAFQYPDAYAGKEIDLAGGELNGLQMAKTFSKALGHDVEFTQLKMEDLKRINPAYAKMFEWLDENGYIADIPSLRIIYPQLHTLEKWLSGDTWARTEEEYLVKHHS